MTTYTWITQPAGDWGAETNWQPTGGPPGVVPTGTTDVADLISTGGLETFIVSVAPGETFNLSTVNLQASNNTHEVNLEIQGGG